jgi:hypothetical protein
MHTGSSQLASRAGIRAARRVAMEGSSFGVAARILLQCS